MLDSSGNLTQGFSILGELFTTFTSESFTTLTLPLLSFLWVRRESQSPHTVASTYYYVFSILAILVAVHYLSVVLGCVPW
jgi:accessory gene regulator protein AgrB